MQIVKQFYVQYNIGKAKFVVSYFDGVKRHNDNSPFFDIRTFKNKRDFKAFVKSLKDSGYKKRI